MILFFSILVYAEEKKMYCNAQQYIQGLEICKEVSGVLFSKNTYLLKYIRGINILCKISGLKTKKKELCHISFTLSSHPKLQNIKSMYKKENFLMCIYILIYVCMWLCSPWSMSYLSKTLIYGVGFFCSGLFFRILEKEYIKYSKYLNLFEYSSWL